FEAIAAGARYGRQSDAGDRELIGFASARREVLADDGAPAPWAVVGGLVARRYAYSDALDPLGALDLGLRAGVSSLGGDDSEVAVLVEVGAGWMFVSRRGSRFRAAGALRLEGGEIFLGASLEAAHALLDGSVLAPGAYAGL